MNYSLAESLDDLAKSLDDLESFVLKYAQVQGVHHKQWVLDQVLRRLKGGTYDSWRELYDFDARSKGLPTWDDGIAP